MTEKEIQIIANKVIQYLQQERKKREEELPKVPLEQKNIQNCELLLNRNTLLKKMPKGSIVGEIGVDEGKFSRLIYNEIKPYKLHLIDIWSTDRYHDGKFQMVR
ncbi:MAG TPA: hypothetical protein VE912_00930, partial [Bacteroidales bacterium]|nr:hypothetical protein [Bacteroidales bacterium]